VCPIQTYNTGTGLTATTQEYPGGPVPLPFSGQQGYQANQVAYCVTSTTGTSTMTGFVDTRIVYEPYVLFAYALSIGDNGGTYFLAGHGYGTTLIQEASVSGKAVTALNNGGYLRLQITGLSHPSGVMSAEGVVRLV
jgi:hypothetical protein